MAALPRTSRRRADWRAPSAPPPGGWRYVVALGSNMRHHRHGPPEGVLAAVGAALGREGVQVLAAAPVIRSAPLGPSLRRYANGALLVASALAPDALLAVLHRVEAAFGRRRARRWGSRVLDLDIALWEGGRWRAPALRIPHAELTRRAFVLVPCARLVPGWRLAGTNLSPAQALAGLTKRRAASR